MMNTPLTEDPAYEQGFAHTGAQDQQLFNPYELSAEGASPGWEVVDRMDNGFSGFGGALFRYVGPLDEARGLRPGDLLISLRTAESALIPESDRVLCQIAAMSGWYSSLHERGLIDRQTSFADTSPDGILAKVLMLRARAIDPGHDVEQISARFHEEFGVPLPLPGRDFDFTAVGSHANDALHGSAGDDFLFGSEGYDVLHGGDGDDLLVGDQGRDTLWGGAGVDTLVGGSGDDVYLVQQGDGETFIAPAPLATRDRGRYTSFTFSDDDTLRLLARRDDVDIWLQNALGETNTTIVENMVVRWKDSSASVVIQDWRRLTLGDLSVDRVEFAEDGSAWSIDVDVLAGTLHTRGLQRGWESLPAGTAMEDEAFSLELPGGVFLRGWEEGTAGTPPVYELEGTPENPVPEWLEIDAQTGRIFGTPRGVNAGTTHLTLAVLATDALGVRLGVPLELSVVGVNDAPPTRDEANIDPRLTAQAPGGLLVLGTRANDTLKGGEGDDVYQGQAGSDQLIDPSNWSSDLYRWGRGEGADTLLDRGGYDRLEVLFGVAEDQLWLQREGTDLTLSILGTDDAFTIRDWYGSAGWDPKTLHAPHSRVEFFQLANGKVLHFQSVESLVQAMSTSTRPALPLDSVPGAGYEHIRSAIAVSWA